MTKSLLIALLFCLPGCTPNLGSPDAPQKFTREVQDQFDVQIDAVKRDSGLSEAEQEREITRIERERESFDAYNRGER
ncbi:MAG: hypothetical protein AB7U20_21520, partial [Planctomycetaceae bacterium]